MTVGRPGGTPPPNPKAASTAGDRKPKTIMDKLETGPGNAGSPKDGSTSADTAKTTSTATATAVSTTAGETATATATKSTTADTAAGDNAAGRGDASASDGTATPADGTAESTIEKDAKGDKDDQDQRDPFASFGPAPTPVPTRIGRATRSVGRFLTHEWTLAALGSLALAVAMTWPTLRYPRYTLPQDHFDPSLQAWQMAWSGQALLTDPGRLLHANAFFPERWSFVFSDTLLGYAPAGMIGTGPEAALLRYNIMFVLAHALATFGAYMLARQLGSGRIGAGVAGVTFTYAPWLLAQAGHLNVISSGGIPLALAMLARGHGWSLRRGYQPEKRRVGWVYAGWLVAAWQLSLGFGIGLPFAYVLAGTGLVATVTWFLRRWVVRPVRRPFGRRLVAANVVGGLIFTAVGGLLALPYFTVVELHPQAERTVGDLASFSPPAMGFLTAPAESRIWGDLHEGARSTLPWPPEMTLLPGYVLYALALGGLFFSVWRVRHRLLLLAGVVVSMVLAMGAEFFDGQYTLVPLFEHLPGWNGLRTPGRLMLWATLLLGLLAAGAVSAFAGRVRKVSATRIPSWPNPWLRLATLLPLLLVTVEGLNRTPHPVVPVQPAAMRTVDGPLLVLPSDKSHDQPVMLWSTTHFQDIVNGWSGFTPTLLEDVRQATITFPDQASVDYLRTLGVRNVLIPRNQVAGTPWEFSIDAPVDLLGITREEIGDVVVYRL